MRALGGDTPKVPAASRFVALPNAANLGGMKRVGDSSDTPVVLLSAAQIDALAQRIAAALAPVVWLTPAEAAEVLGVPVPTLAQWRYRGQGPRYSKVGSLVRYSRRDLDAWLVDAAVDPRSA